MPNLLILWNTSNTLVLLAIALQNDLGNLAVKKTYFKKFKTNIALSCFSFEMLGMRKDGISTKYASHERGTKPFYSHFTSTVVVFLVGSHVNSIFCVLK